MNLVTPEAFQGNVRAKRYFEGWYFKHVSADLGRVYAFIPGIALSPEKRHAFIQVLNGITGETRYCKYDVADFSADRRRLCVRVGASTFTDSSIDLAIDKDDFKVSGRIEYAGRVAYPRSLVSPGIMGWYTYVPFMECNHGIVSANHRLDGAISVQGQRIDFTSGHGYIEKDWGASFPEAWIWLQCNSFEEPDRSLFFSVAKIPWLGRFFIGFICFLYDRGKFFTFATYNNSRLVRIVREGARLTILLQNRKYSLEIGATIMGGGELAAPVLGAMTRKIKESVDSEVEVRMSTSKGSLLLEDHGRRAGLEIIEKIFEYLK